MTGIVWSDRFLEHDTGAQHPERAGRLLAVRERLSSCGLEERLVPLDARPASIEDLLRVHDASYLEQFHAACLQGAPMMHTADCPVCPATFEVSQLAAGAALAAVDAVMAGAVGNAFVACRPPGHHAERGRAMGFCYINHVAVAAEHLRAVHRVERVAILDWDVHHGNGTQHLFEADPDVFFCSIHQHPDTLYPGTGYAWERGRDAGLGATLNVPMLPGSTDSDYQRALEQTILPALSDFEPEFILISAGFDAHRDDPLANVDLTAGAFAAMTRLVHDLADACCRGRLLSVLEGGYNLAALAECVEVHLRALQASKP